MSGKNYFELCNDVLEELYYEKAETFDELEDMAEGRRVKKMLNQALAYICNNENQAWEFRNKETDIVLVPGMKTYDRPNGMIEYMKYPDRDLVLGYYEDHRYLPNNCNGLPTGYYISNDKINFFPTPSESEDDILIKVEYYTNDFAEDCCGLGKPLMKYEKDIPIIPARHRDILVWKVCADWRGNDRDGHYEHYEAKFKRAYRALLMDCVRTLDRPRGLQIGSQPQTIVQSLFNAWQIRTQSSKGNM